MLFACIFTERKEGGYNSYDFRPFVALKKVNNQGIVTYLGCYLKEDKIGEPNDWRWVVKIGNKVSKPISFMDTDRIFVSNNLSEIIELYLDRFRKAV